LVFSNNRDEYPDTIYRVLKGKEEFSKLVKLIDSVPSIRDTLDSDKKLTFFAPSNDAIEGHHYYSWNNFDDHDKKKKRIVEDTFKYHIVPGVLEYRLFGQNSTIATHLQARDGSFDDARRRIKVESSVLPPWKTTLNNYVSVTESDIHAKNGVIHKISSPLYLPPDVMDLLYLLPADFSISATALLKTNLQNNLEFNSDFKKKGHGGKHLEHHNDRHGKGSPVTTFFVPSNDAWNKLPEDLVFFLFSPAGERTLRKLMSWHTLPDTVVFTEWGRHVHHDSDSDATVTDDEPDLSFEWDHHISTFVNQKMPVHVKKSQSKVPGSRVYNVALQAHGIYATVVDNPAQNGAFHVVPQVLSPRSVEGVDEAQNEKDWQEWREWLTDWSFEHTEADSE